jgi:hypothetical protein
MLVRLLFPDPHQHEPGRADPNEMPLHDGAPPGILGPMIQIHIAGMAQKAHVQEHPALGPFLLQPLIQNLVYCCSVDQAFASWNQVLHHRNRLSQAMPHGCPWHKEMVRHEMSVLVE